MTDLYAILTAFVGVNFTLLIMLFSLAIVNYLVKGIANQIAVLSVILVSASLIIKDTFMVNIGILAFVLAVMLKIMKIE